MQIVYIIFMMYTFCRSELMYTKWIYTKCIPNFDKLLHTFCIYLIKNLAAKVLLILFTKCIQKFVKMWYAFCTHQLYTSCIIFVSKMYTQFPCGYPGIPLRKQIKQLFSSFLSLFFFPCPLQKVKVSVKNLI